MNSQLLTALVANGTIGGHSSTPSARTLARRAAKKARKQAKIKRNRELWHKMFGIKVPDIVEQSGDIEVVNASFSLSIEQAEILKQAIAEGKEIIAKIEIK